MSLTGLPNGVKGVAMGNNPRLIEASETLAASESVYVKSDAITLTLPAYAIGLTFRIFNMAEDGSALLTISPNSNDGIAFAAQHADNKDILNTKATQKKGDFVILTCTEIDANHWIVTDSAGVWAAES